MGHDTVGIKFNICCLGILRRFIGSLLLFISTDAFCQVPLIPRTLAPLYPSIKRLQVCLPLFFVLYFAQILSYIRANMIFVPLGLAHFTEQLEPFGYQACIFKKEILGYRDTH